MITSGRTDHPPTQADVAFVDRRKSIRFALRVPVTFDWTDEVGNRHRGEGITRDIGSKGEFVQSRSCPPDATRISLDILLPRIPTAIRSLRIQAEGWVVRVEAEEGDSREAGFAVRNERSALAVR